MPVFEVRTYTLQPGKMAEAVRLYSGLGLPILEREGFTRKLLGYFQADTGTLNQLIHWWKFDDDADRRAHWAALYANKPFIEEFAPKLRALLVSQEVKLLVQAPFGPRV